MEVCAVWLARDFLRTAGRPIDIPPCQHPTDSCPPIREGAPMTTLINLCPHDMHVYGFDVPDQIDPDQHAPIRVYPPSGDIARTATTELGQFLLTDELVIVVDHSGTTGLPEYAGHMDSRDREVWYIVSLPTALSARRDDLLVPYAAVRNMQGQVIGCRMFAKPA